MPDSTYLKCALPEIVMAIYMAEDINDAIVNCVSPTNPAEKSSGPTDPASSSSQITPQLLPYQRMFGRMEAIFIVTARFTYVANTGLFREIAFTSFRKAISLGQAARPMCHEPGISAPTLKMSLA